MDVLQLSFNGLEEMEKEIFLDIACFFNGIEEKYVKDVLDCCGFHSEIGLRVLFDKSLINISDKSMIEMHGLLEELGRKNVQQKGPRMWSRLWLPEHYNNVMSENMEKKVEAVVLRCERKTEVLMAEALSKMSHLRLLILVGVDFRGSVTCLSNELRYVKWDAYPLQCFPSSFQPNLLVELILPNSNIRELWEGNKCMPNLRILDLRDSCCLMNIPDFKEVPNLERLNLKRCISLHEMDPSIGVLRKLVYLNLEGCENLKISSNIFGLSTLKYLNLFGCSRPFDMKDDSKRSVLKRIVLPFHSSTSQTQHPIPKANPYLAMANLRELDIRYCCLSQIPVAIGSLRSLEKLLLGGDDFRTLPSLRELSKLSYLSLEHCKHLEYLPELPSAFTIDDMFSDTAYSRTAGLYIFNCPWLGDAIGWCKHVFSWMVQSMLANQESRCRIDIVIPESQIPIDILLPLYMTKGGSTISIDPDPIIHGNYVIAVAFCVVFIYEAECDSYCHRTHRKGGLNYRLQLCIRRGDLKVSFSIPLIANHAKSACPIRSKSNHIWVANFTQKSFFDIMTQLDNAVGNLFQMEVLVVDSEGSYVEVKNFGYQWISKHYLQHFKITMPADRDGC